MKKEIRKFICDICGIEIQRCHADKWCAWYQHPDIGEKDICVGCRNIISKIQNMVEGHNEKHTFQHR